MFKTTNDKIILHLLDLNLLDDDPIANGIAKKVKADGYNSLSQRQKYVINKHMSINCEGFSSHGVSEKCITFLEGEQLLEALETFIENDRMIMCSDCIGQRDFLNHRYDKLMEE